MKYLTIKNLIERYSISRSTILRLVDAGEFPRPVRIGLASKRWAIEDLEKFEAGKKNA